jgi:ATP-dependent helicase HrpB
MSATLNAGELENYLNPCAVLSSAGRQFPVEIEYAAPPERHDRRPIWEQAAEAFARYVSRGGEGDVLIFMPGGFEISQTIEALRQTPASKGFIQRR